MSPSSTKRFEAITVALGNTEATLTNARALFGCYLNGVFTHKGKDWRKQTLAEIGWLQTGTTPKTSEKGNLGKYIPFIKPGDFRGDGSLDYENEGLSKIGLGSSRLIRAGSVVMVCIGATIGKAAFVERDISANQQINAVTPIDACCGKFLYYQMISSIFQGDVIANSAQATLPIINKTRWGNLTVHIPKSVSEQEKIISALDKLSVEIQRLEAVYGRKLSALRELKQAFLRKAFTGELSARPSPILKLTAA